MSSIQDGMREFIDLMGDASDTGMSSNALPQIQSPGTEFNIPGEIESCTSMDDNSTSTVGQMGDLAKALQDVFDSHGVDVEIVQLGAPEIEQEPAELEMPHLQTYVNDGDCPECGCSDCGCGSSDITKQMIADDSCNEPKTPEEMAPKIDSMGRRDYSDPSAPSAAARKGMTGM